jgi:hypothetical protein
MPEPDYIIKRGDFGSSIAATLLDENDQPANLTGSSVSFRMVPIAVGGTLVVSSAATIVGVATLGNVSYEWAQGDTDDAEGFYLGEWQVTYAGGDPQTFPNGDYTVIQVVPDLPL